MSEPRLFDEFLAGARTGHSASHHIEESALLIDRIAPVALRLDEGVVLIRTDVQSRELLMNLPGLGYSIEVEDPQLATVVSLQVLGMPAAMWDLWARQGADGRETLERVAGVDAPGAGW